MAFFTFDQNNSGGYFVGPHYIIIEADDAEEANQIAEVSTPIYFGGVRSGKDCACCGSRWSRKYPEEEGDDFPSIYGSPLSGHENCLTVPKK